MKALRVLVLEDNVDLAELYAVVLRKRGHDVQVIEQFHERWTHADAWLTVLPDVAIIDLHLDGMSGLPILRVANGLEPRPRIIIATGSPGKQLVTQDVDTLSDAFLHKPFTLAQLADAVEQATSHRKET